MTNQPQEAQGGYASSGWVMVAVFTLLGIMLRNSRRGR